MSKAEQKHAKVLRPDESHKKGCVLRCTNKGHHHRENGYDYAAANYQSYYNKDFKTDLSAKARLDAVYPPPSLFRRQRGWDPRYTPGTWDIGLNKPNNWKAARHPFGNQAHHILPIGALHDSFDVMQLAILQNSGYNINAGVNIIILPVNARLAGAMLMLCHPTKHDDYSDAVENVISQIKSKFAKGASDPNDHTPVDDENIPNIKKELEQWSMDEAAELMIAGADSPGAPVNDANVFSVI